MLKVAITNLQFIWERKNSVFTKTKKSNNIDFKRQMSQINIASYKDNRIELIINYHRPEML